jgi:phage terminase large subunit
MRKGIFKDVGGVRTFDIQKIIGKGFGNGWFTNCNARYRIFEGARATGKSKRMLGYESIFKILADSRRNIVICRQDDVNNRQSTFANIVKCIYDLGLEGYFKTKSQPLEITYVPTGQKIVFRGMNNPTSITSIEFETGYLTDVYIEEAFEVNSYEDFNKLDGSIRTGADYDDEGNLVDIDVPLQITLLLNPWSESHWIYQKFFRGRLEDDVDYLLEHKYMDLKDDDYIGDFGYGLYLHKSTYKVNEFRDRRKDRALEEMRKVNFEKYKVLALGCWGNTSGPVYPNFGTHCIIGEDKIRDNYIFPEFAIGIDAGFSNGQGGKRKVKKGEDATAVVRSATTAVLCGCTPGFKELVFLDEYYHTNNADFADFNTDTQKELTMPEIADNIVQQIIKWKNKYGGSTKRGDLLMKGTIYAYVDNADIGFRQTLQAKAQEHRLFNIEFVGSTKRDIQIRVDFADLLQSYSRYLVSEKCNNLIREIKNARRGEKGEARSNINEHTLDASEYAFTPFMTSFDFYPMLIENKTV